MKHLKIEYTKDNGRTVILFDEEVNEVVWNDTDNGVRVEGKIKTAGGGGLLDLIAQASKARTEAAAEEKRAAAEAEVEQVPVPEEDPRPVPRPAAVKKPAPVIIEAEDAAEAV